MTPYQLPRSLEVGGECYEIRTDFRAVIDVLIAMHDPDLDEYGRAMVMLQIIYPKWAEIPTEHIQEAVNKACSFIDCGQTDDGSPKPRVMDWEQDATIIIPAVNKVAHFDVREREYLHWWTFYGFFMEIGESTFASVIHIRQKMRNGEKLEKWEKKFYSQNMGLCDLKQRHSKEEQDIIDYLNKWLGGG